MPTKTPAQELNAREHKLIVEAKRLASGRGLPTSAEKDNAVELATARLALFEEKQAILKQQFADVFKAKRAALASHILRNATAELRVAIALAQIEQEERSSPDAN